MVAARVARCRADFDVDAEWWQLAFTPEGDIVGYLQPATYPGCDKDGLVEATLYNLGVVPEQRGHRHVDDLLLQAVATMQRVGMWRMYCDTSVQNRPMVASLERVGFVPDGTNYIWSADLQEMLRTLA